MKILVTGAAGFIGFHLIKALLEAPSLENEETIVGIDNINDYYDPNLKNSRLQILNEMSSIGNFRFIKLDLADQTLYQICLLKTILILSLILELKLGFVTL
ncbi:hypothetical protein PKHYL_30430 [Psychrobacter sp. KH172YL61]|nr:hypothetical protein PKHYL_30430 [Psychrobacter sp. KH172YL61]